MAALATGALGTPSASTLLPGVAVSGSTASVGSSAGSASTLPAGGDFLSTLAALLGAPTQTPPAGGAADGAPRSAATPPVDEAVGSGSAPSGIPTLPDAPQDVAAAEAADADDPTAADAAPDALSYAAPAVLVAQPVPSSPAVAPPAPGAGPSVDSPAAYAVGSPASSGPFAGGSAAATVLAAPEAGAPAGPLPVPTVHEPDPGLQAGHPTVQDVRTTVPQVVSPVSSSQVEGASALRVIAPTPSPFRQSESLGSPPASSAASTDVPAAGAAAVAATPLVPSPRAPSAGVPVASATVPSPTEPRAFAQQLARPVATLAVAAPGEHVLTVRVSPEHLGPLTVQAHVGPDGVRIELFSPTEAGRAAVHAALPDLRRELAGTGLGASLELSGRGAPAHDGSAPHGGHSSAGQRGNGGPDPATRVRVDGARADPVVPSSRPPQSTQPHARLDVLV